MSLITATESAPASITSAARSRVIPPIATIGFASSVPDAPDKFGSNDRIRILFALSGKHGSYCNIIRRTLHRRSKLFFVVRRNANPLLRPQSLYGHRPHSNPSAPHELPTLPRNTRCRAGHSQKMSRLLQAAMLASSPRNSSVSRALPPLLRYCNIRTPASINCLAVSSAEPVISPASNITYNLGITRRMKRLFTVGDSVVFR